MFAYITESEVFDFKDENLLFWHQEDIKYGDWLGGLNGDGTYEMSGKVPVPEVMLLKIYNIIGAVLADLYSPNISRQTARRCQCLVVPMC